MKNQSGITLIALVITAIVLLILAGVSINMALGDNGIVGKARGTKRAQIVAEKKEEVKMAITELLIENNGDGSSIIVSSSTSAQNNVLSKVKEKYSLNIQNSISGEGVDENEEYAEENILGIITYKNPAISLRESITLYVDKDYNVDEYEEFQDVYSDLATVTPEVSTFNICNSPDLSGFNPENTYYVVYDSNDKQRTAGRIDRVPAPNNWYKYENEDIEGNSDSKWANIVTVNGDEVAYWTWIPRYEYSVDTENQFVDVKFIPTTQIEPDKINPDDVNSESYQIPKSFRFGNDGDLDEANKNDYKELAGYWMSKYEVQSSGRPELEKIYQEKHGNTVTISTTNPSGKYRIYVEGIEIEANDYSSTTGVELPYNIKGLKKTKKYDICVESVDRQKVIGKTKGLTSENIHVDISGFDPKKTYYVAYKEDGTEKITGRLDKVSQPENWYNYDNKIWANLVTVNQNNVTYWTYIPRYEYRVEPSGKESIDVRYIPKSQIAPSNSFYQIPKSFRFGNDGDLDEEGKNDYKELDGYWMSKYEVQISELREKEMMIKKIKNGKMKITTTNPSGTYTVFLNGVEYANEINLNEPYIIDIGSSAENDVLLINEQTNRVFGEASSSKIEIDLSGFNPDCTYYVEYDDQGNKIENRKIELNSDGSPKNMPDNWYDYDSKKWANIVTKNKNSEGKEIIAYWTYIPRYEYRVLNDEQEIDIKYISLDQTKADTLYEIPDSFKFGDTPLKGYWMSKYEVQEFKE